MLDTNIMTSLQSVTIMCWKCPKGSTNPDSYQTEATDWSATVANIVFKPFNYRQNIISKISGQMLRIYMLTTLY